MSRLLLFLVLASLAGCPAGGRTTVTPAPPEPAPAEPAPRPAPAPALAFPAETLARHAASRHAIERARHERWVDSVLATMSLRAKAGQLLMRWIPGTFAGPRDAEHQRALRWVREDSIGGFIISIGPPEQLAAGTNALQRASAVPLLISADLEFGPGQRLIPGGATFPPPMGVAATGDASASCWHGRLTALEARAVGIHWTFAPDVDINVIPDNPIVNARAYGETAETVVRFATPFVRCAEAAGLMTTAKHFVGHGMAAVDSHIDLPVLDLARSRLDSVELAPFRAAQRAGVSAIMSAHLAIPALTGDTMPISLDRRILSGMLRDEWGFDGLLVTDAMWMGGVARAPGFSPESAAVLALRAGNDVILDPRDHRPMQEAIVAAVRTGRLAEARLDSSVRRVLLAKARLGLPRERLVDERAVRGVVGLAATDSAVADVTRRSLVLARDRRSLVPIDAAAHRRIVVVLYLDEGVQPAPGVHPGRAFTAQLRRRLAGDDAAVESIVLTPRSGADEIAEATRRAAGAELAIIAPFIRAVASKGTIGFPPAIERLTREVAERQERTILVSFGDPYLLRQAPAVPTYVLAWNPWSAPAERAAADALTGHAPFSGRLPVTVDDIDRGSGIQMHAMHRPAAPPLTPAAVGSLRRAVDTLLARAVADSAFPGAVAVVGRGDGVLFTSAAGSLDWSPSPRTDERTLWDLASLTKVVGLTTALMRLVDEGRVDLDAPVQRYLPDWTGEHKERVTVRHLLTHTSGLPAYRRLFLETTSRDTALAMILAEPLDTVPGARMVYSDFGAILAGLVVERVTGESFDAYLRRQVFEPLGMRETGFRPDRAVLERVAPTEFDPWRQRHVRGEVHDENAFILGGVSAHAGLFAPATDLARFARMLLNGGTLDGTRIVSRRTVALFTRVQQPELSHRALGWETSTGHNSGGRLLSPTAFGHTGFTGTSIWVDPSNDVFVILLSNRVNPTRENRRIFDVRVALADAVLSAVDPRHLPTFPDRP